METDNYFVHNKETEKLNIYTTKQFYSSLEEEKRKIFKKYCLWSSTQECWVSKAKAENAVYLRSKLSEMGFVDGGSTGERLPFEEKVQREQEKAEYYTKAESAEWTARGKKYKNPNYLLNRIKEAKSAIKLFGRYLEGNFYRGSPNREISTVERDFYTEKLKEYHEKLEFFEQHMLKVNPKYFEQSAQKKSKKNNRGL